MTKPHEILGIIGGAMLVLAYALMVDGDIDSKSFTYNALMLVGCLALAVNVFVQRAWPAVVLQIVFAGVAAWAIVKGWITWQ